MIAHVYMPLWPFAVAFIAICLGPDIVRWCRGLIDGLVAHERMLDDLWDDDPESVGATVGPQSSSLEQLTAGPTARTGGCICDPRWAHVMADADCPEHGLASLSRSGVYDQEKQLA